MTVSRSWLEFRSIESVKLNCFMSDNSRWRSTIYFFLSSRTLRSLSARVTLYRWFISNTVTFPQVLNCGMDRIKEWINDYEAILGYAKWLIIFRGLSLEYFIVSLGWICVDTKIHVFCLFQWSILHNKLCQAYWFMLVFTSLSVGIAQF